MATLQTPAGPSPTTPAQGPQPPPGKQQAALSPPGMIRASDRNPDRCGDAPTPDRRECGTGEPRFGSSMLIRWAIRTGLGGVVLKSPPTLVVAAKCEATAGRAHPWGFPAHTARDSCVRAERWSSEAAGSPRARAPPASTCILADRPPLPFSGPPSGPSRRMGREVVLGMFSRIPVSPSWRPLPPH